MKDNKAINKIQEIDKYEIEKMDLSVKGNILYVISSESGGMFILTDEDNFYAIEKGKFNEMKEYKLQSNVLEMNKKKKEEEKKSKSKSESNDLDSQIWCDKLGTHVIIKYINTNFYYNPFMALKIEELNIMYLGTIYLEPCAVAFNDDFYDPNNTGEIIFSDSNSIIYEL